MGMKCNLCGADDYMMQLETDIDMVFDDKDNDEDHHGFMAQYIVADTWNINRVILQLYIFLLITVCLINLSSDLLLLSQYITSLGSVILA